MPTPVILGAAKDLTLPKTPWLTSAPAECR